MTTLQLMSMLWSFFHLAIAVYLQPGAHGNLSMTALSHLLLFDALAACFSLLVDVGHNFEAYGQSTIKYPYGLVRSEVLAGMALSITLFFYGVDLLSHTLVDVLEQSFGHEPHHGHPLGEKEFAHAKAGTVNLAALGAMLITLSSAILSGTAQAHIGRFLQLPSLVPATVRNQSHILPLSLSLVLLMLPLLGIQMTSAFDRILAFGYAAYMAVLGGQLCYANAQIILNSFPVAAVSNLILELERDTTIVVIDEAKIFQVHYGLCVANFKFRVRHMDQAEDLQERVEALVQNRLASYRPGVAWETTIQITLWRPKVAHKSGKSDKPAKSGKTAKGRGGKGSRK
jgi:divalent metal cation (Fe/Co/Zn/Cd) transporter